MVWGGWSPDSLATQQLPQVDATMPFAAVGDEDLADMGPTQILTDQPAKRLGAYRKPHREVLTWRQTGATAVALGVLVFGAVWVLSVPGSPAPEAVRQAAPDAPVATTSLTPKPKAKPSPVRPAEPVVRRYERPEPPARTVVVTIAAKPKASATPKPTTSSPKPTATPEPTSPDPVETSEPADTDDEPTPATEATDGDS